MGSSAVEQVLDDADATFRNVASFLRAHEALSLAATGRSQRVVRLISETLAETDKHWRNPPSRYEAIRWQTLPSRGHTGMLRGLWQDQGWGNQKGMISVVEDARGARAPGDYKPWPPCVRAGCEPAPHSESSFKLEWTADAPCALWVRVGGGGGHELSVEDLDLRTLVYASDVPATTTSSS